MTTPTLRSTLMALVLLAAAAGVGSTADAPLDNGQRPGHGGDATTVEAFLFLIDVTRIDGANQSITADLFVLLRWHDPRLASSEGARRLELDDVWNPRVQILNQRSVSKSFPEQVDVSADGQVTYRQRYFGEFSAQLDLHDFPMDRHTIGFHLVVPGYDRDQVALVPPGEGAGTALSGSLSIVDWEVSDFTSRIADFQVAGDARSVAGLVAAFRAQRYLGFYASKAVLSVAIIVFMSWIVFWIDPKNLPPRMSVTVTAMLTLIAYRFLLGQMLPPLSYLTRMDHFLLGSTLLVFLAIVEVGVASRLLDSGRRERALGLDRLSRWVFPVAFLVLCVVSFWAP